VSVFRSAFRYKEEDVFHTRNNWVCCDFKEKRIVPTYQTICTHCDAPGGAHLKSWLVETSDGEIWRDVARKDDSRRLNKNMFTGTIAGRETAASSDS
jgi:hypothetical protein